MRSAANSVSLLMTGPYACFRPGIFSGMPNPHKLNWGDFLADPLVGRSRCRKPGPSGRPFPVGLHAGR